MTDKFRISHIKGAPASGEILCVIDDIVDGTAKEFSFHDGDDIHDLFIQRNGGQVYAYVNICPHAGTPLNMEEGEFTEKSGRYFMCHTHGALFQLEDGLCVAGPCNGAKLQAVDVILKDGNILVV
ncbi:MAG: Rieske (2Fe-2S) protein [Kordiimonadaceae bacterium]|nr:Rieske (2Fe-2S) protein [Kordiimonadaceae bacterium]MBT6032442.1 Rieske (2Fe-2S) protein [Kordiimonadaceae bacterium]